MGLLWDFNANAYVDSRQDNRNMSQANSYTFAPYIAYPGATISGNKASSSATAEAEQANADGFTGKNGQNVLIAVGAVGVAAALGYVLLKV
jgi:hypothetical protein